MAAALWRTLRHVPAVPSSVSSLRALRPNSLLAGRVRLHTSALPMHRPTVALRPIATISLKGTPSVVRTASTKAVDAKKTAPAAPGAEKSAANDEHNFPPGHLPASHPDEDEYEWRGLPAYQRWVLRKLRSIFKPKFELYHSRLMYTTCLNQARKEEFYKACNLPDTYQSWFIVTALHVYLYLLRLKAEGDESRSTRHALYIMFFEDVEHRMRMTGVSSGTVVVDTLREFNSNFLGFVVSFDEGLISDDTVLASALWRNLFRMTGKPADIELLTRYVRREIKRMDDIEYKYVLLGRVPFGPVFDAQDAKSSGAS